VPSCEWGSASDSLRSLGGYLRTASMRVKRNRSLRFREKASEGLATSAAALEAAARLFQPGGFFMPPDPRDIRPQEQAGPFPGASWALEPNTEPQMAPGSYGARLLQEVREELGRAVDYAERRAALRRLVRRSHPDQNPGHEEEVLPVLRYVQDLRERDGARR